MLTWIQFWVAKLVVQLTIAFLILVVALALTVPRAWRQRRCRHDGGVHETQACDAICRKCGQNLGFIGPWRETPKKEA